MHFQDAELHLTLVRAAFGIRDELDFLAPLMAAVFDVLDFFLFLVPLTTADFAILDFFFFLNVVDVPVFLANLRAIFLRLPFFFFFVDFDFLAVLTVPVPITIVGDLPLMESFPEEV